MLLKADTEHTMVRNTFQLQCDSASQLICKQLHKSSVIIGLGTRITLSPAPMKSIYILNFCCPVVHADRATTVTHRTHRTHRANLLLRKDSVLVFCTGDTLTRPTPSPMRAAETPHTMAALVQVTESLAGTIHRITCQILHSRPSPKQKQIWHRNLISSVFQKDL